MVEKNDKRPWYKTKTFWACVLLFIGGGLEAVGVSNALEIAKNIAYAAGASGALYGVADRLRK